MSFFMSSNANRVSVELGHIGARAYKNVAAAVSVAGKQVEKEWKTNATQTAGVHGKHYPNAIQGRTIHALEYRIEPDEGMRQGAMSFEYGSRNQPPHLDALRAFDSKQAAAQRLIRRAVEGSL